MVPERHAPLMKPLLKARRTPEATAHFLGISVFFVTAARSPPRMATRAMVLLNSAIGTKGKDSDLVVPVPDVLAEPAEQRRKHKEAQRQRVEKTMVDVDRCLLAEMIRVWRGVVSYST
jgi:hypothetical protein